jgi:hypothetical protein
MNSIFRLEVLLPISLLIIQAFILLLIFITILKRINILKTPYAGMEYSQLIVTSAFLFGIFFIATADTEATFQAFKTFQNAGEKTFSSTFNKFSQFFLVVIFFEMIFSLISLLVAYLFLGLKNPKKEIAEGNIPACILFGITIIGFAIVLQYSAKELVQYITPQYLNFR